MLVNWIFRNAGAFFMRRTFREDALYRAVFTECVAHSEEAAECLLCVVCAR